ncbi:protein PAIR1 [Punica granatum]|uniref:Protein PAIR1 n=1 Tax=Punica granatum TaxID=22663 RepID=A0A218VV23_PUNGR|nr:protein PAIR1 [Punica granatum]XP_031383066.1 protein PAIR1 [Punica granatum]OWM64246.1 hypothetical protein CDL15_Pgr018818 [Punica granatum]
MKLKINKACDLSSISVLPPHGRRPGAAPGGVQASQFHSQQQSQQSFSQGISAQHGMFSQLSQNSSDDFLTSDQRYSSQERENSVKKISTLVNYSQEDIRMPLSRNSSNLARKWNSTSMTDNRCHISEELEHRIGLMETSLSRFGRILDSVQSDVMQVSKGTKEISLEIESIRQKLISHDDSLQQLKKGQADVKASLDGGFKSISDQLSKGAHENKFLEIYSRISAIPVQIEASVMKFQDQVRYNFTREMQAFSSVLKLASQKSDASAHPQLKGIEVLPVPQRETRLLKGSSPCPISSLPPDPVTKTEMGGWTSVKQEKQKCLVGALKKENIQKEAHPFEKLSMQEREGRVLIESDEEIEGGFACLIDEERGAYAQLEDKGSYTIDEVKVETERILRKARKRKRKHSSVIIIN